MLKGSTTPKKSCNPITTFADLRRDWKVKCRRLLAKEESREAGEGRTIKGLREFISVGIAPCGCGGNQGRVSCRGVTGVNLDRK